MVVPSIHFVIKRICVVATLISLTSGVAWAGSYKVLYAFKGRYAKNPSSGLVLDKAGNAYGTTAGGGFHNGTGGTVYQISPTTGVHLIYGFSGPDGLQPQGNLAVDDAGNIYGTTVYGGSNSKGCNNLGCGTVFKLSPPTNGGAWTETVLYSFSGGDDGSNLKAGVALDATGTLYGTTMNGGKSNFGVVFELNMGLDDSWTEQVLYSFGGGSRDGGLPQCKLAIDDAGNLYGTSGLAVFEMLRGGSGWTFTPIYFFDWENGDAALAETGVIFDRTGNLFGTSSSGGAFNLGTVFKLTQSLGSWSETIIHNFAGNDGAQPEAAPVFDADGNLYGTTFAGGSSNECFANGCGTIFELTPGQNGQWIERRLSVPFKGDVHNGTQPTTPLFLDGAGHIYGTMPGGAQGSGVIFRITI